METKFAYGRRSKDRNGAGCTPFRYPGGKAFLADMLEERVRKSGAEVTTYAEPYAGGAGAAIELLARGAVNQVILNDFDRRIYAAWWAILNRNEDFIARVESTPITLESWYNCRKIVEDNESDGDLFEMGFATYFLNRTNRSGVIIGAGPIGGYGQTGKWLIDARWYATTMTRRLRWLGEMKESIKLHNKDGLRFLQSFEEGMKETTFFFIDPPYVQAGAKLYLNAMSDLKHLDLAKFLTGPKAIPHWLVTYDECQLIKDAYATASVERVPVRYSLQRKRTEHEVCVVPA